MTSSELGIYEGKKLTLHQFGALEDAEKVGLPQGCTWYWQWGDERILTPGRVVEIIVKSASEGKLDVQRLTDPAFIQSHFQRLRTAQVEMLQSQMAGGRANVENLPIPEADKENLRKHYDGIQAAIADPQNMPGMSGMGSDNQFEAMERLYKQFPELARAGRGIF